MSLMLLACCKAQMHSRVFKLISKQMLRCTPGRLIWPPPRPAVKSLPCNIQFMWERPSSCASDTATELSPRSGCAAGLAHLSCESFCSCREHSASNAAGTRAARISGALHTGTPAAWQSASRWRHQPKSCGTLAAKRRLIQRGQSSAGKWASPSAKGARHTGISRRAVRCRTARWSTQKLGAVPRSSPLPSCAHSTQTPPPSRRRTSWRRWSTHCMIAFSDLPATNDTSVRTKKAAVPPTCASCSDRACSSSGRLASPSCGSRPPKQTHASASAGAKMPQKARDGRARSKQRWRYTFRVGSMPRR
mmetsp:Transcript_5173/g.15420  ORF Transcript_5173/g.15420 Transcript_5173/m.15420 type:complete len:305 (-) Transcript_5173:5166-6080(-)